MSPLQLAENLAKSDDPKSRVLGVAILTRGLTDGDPATFTAGWPLDANSVRAAARHLGLGSITEDFADEVLMLAPQLGDAILNKGAR